MGYMKEQVHFYWSMNLYRLDHVENRNLRNCENHDNCHNLQWTYRTRMSHHNETEKIQEHIHPYRIYQRNYIHRNEAGNRSNDLLVAWLDYLSCKTRKNKKLSSRNCKRKRQLHKSYLVPNANRTLSCPPLNSVPSVLATASLEARVSWNSINLELGSVL